jgi:hypothetical protein
MKKILITSLLLCIPIVNTGCVYAKSGSFTYFRVGEVRAKSISATIGTNSFQIKGYQSTSSELLEAGFDAGVNAAKKSMIP